MNTQRILLFCCLLGGQLSAMELQQQAVAAKSGRSAVLGMDMPMGGKVVVVEPAQLSGGYGDCQLRSRRLSCAKPGAERLSLDGIKELLTECQLRCNLLVSGNYIFEALLEMRMKGLEALKSNPLFTSENLAKIGYNEKMVNDMIACFKKYLTAWEG